MVFKRGKRELSFTLPPPSLSSLLDLDRPLQPDLTAFSSFHHGSVLFGTSKISPAAVALASFSALHSVSRTGRSSTTSPSGESTVSSVVTRLLPVAHCDVAEDFSFQGASGATDIPIDQDSGDTIDVSSASSKDYVPELKPLYWAFIPINLLGTVTRCAVMGFLPVVEYYLPHEDAEEGSKPRTPPDPWKAAQSTGWMVVREISVVTIRRVLEKFILTKVAPRAGWKFTKDVFRSARRKAERGLSTFTLSKRVAWTTFRGHIFGALGSITFQWSLDFASMTKRALRRGKNPTGRAQVLREELALLPRKWALHAIKSSVALLTGSLGAGLGVCIWREKGAFVGFAVGDLMGPACVAYFLDDIIIPEDMKKKGEDGA